MMTIEQKAQALGRGLFADLDEGVRSAVAARTGERRLQHGEVLFLEGEPGSEIFFVISGEVEVHRHHTTLAVVGPGEVLGEMAVLGGQVRSASGRARGETHLLFLKDKAARVLVQQTPAFALALLGVLVDRLTAADELAVLLSERPRPLGEVVVTAGDAAGEQVPILRAVSVLGRKRGAIMADGLRVALPSDDPALRERHAEIRLRDAGVYLAPLEGQVAVAGQPVAEPIALGPDDEVAIGELRLRVRVHPGAPADEDHP